MIVNDVFIDRAIFTAIGGIVGLLVGLLISAIREAREAKSDCHELRNLVEHWMEHESHHRDQRGRTSFETIALALVVLLTAYAAFASQIALNKSSETQDCTIVAVYGALTSLNERTTYSEEQIGANIKLQRSQAEFLSVAVRQGPEDERQEAFLNYFNALTNYNEVSQKTAAKQRSYPIPDPQDYRDCLDGK